MFTDVQLLILRSQNIFKVSLEDERLETLAQVYWHCFDSDIVNFEQFLHLPPCFFLDITRKLGCIGSGNLISSYFSRN